MTIYEYDSLIKTIRNARRLATFDTGDVTWIGQDDDGYWFRAPPVNYR